MPLLNSPLQIHRVLNRWYRFRLLRGHAVGILPQWVNCHPTDRSRICMDIIWQYSSKANSSNVHDFLLIIGTVLNLVKKMYSSTCSSSILCLVVCVQLYPGRSEASCQIPALAFFISGCWGCCHTWQGELTTVQFHYLQCVPKKYSGAGIPCTFCATGDDIRYGSFVKKTVYYYLLILRLQTLPRLLVGSAFMQSRLTALIFRAEHRQIFIQRLKVQLDYYRCSPAHSLHENIIAADWSTLE